MFRASRRGADDAEEGEEEEEEDEEGSGALPAHNYNNIRLKISVTDINMLELMNLSYIQLKGKLLPQLEVVAQGPTMPHVRPRQIDPSS